jgi:hypothetical protein
VPSPQAAHNYRAVHYETPLVIFVGSDKHSPRTSSAKPATRVADETVEAGVGDGAFYAPS